MPGTPRPMGSRPSPDAWALKVLMVAESVDSAEEDDVPIRVRVTDDSGNVGTGTAMLRRRHSSGHSPAEQARPRDEL